jgi:hypothetical protein
MTTDSDAVVCERCGGPTEFRREGSTEGTYCTRCDWSVVTTYIPEILRDDTAYEIRARGGDHKNQEHVKVVAALANLNFLAARKLLEQTEPVVFKGEAVAVQRARESLVDAGMDYTINPKFPW